MSLETLHRTIAAPKRSKPAKYWAFFTKDDSAFWNFVDGSREGLKPQGAPSQQSEPPQKMPHPIRLHGRALQPLTESFQK
jgi:hypothetical protein